MPDSPSAELRAAATRLRELAEGATPGPWERPLDTRYKNFVMAALPEPLADPVGADLPPGDLYGPDTDEEN